MILESFRVRDYKSIRDSGEVEVRDAVTCLVGKNESGKTSLMEALYRLNPLPTGHPECFVALRDYPRRFYARDREQVPDTRAVTAVFELEDEDLRAVEEVHGHGVLASRRVTVSRNYRNDLRWEFECNEGPGFSVSPGSSPEPGRAAPGGDTAQESSPDQARPAAADAPAEPSSNPCADPDLVDGIRQSLERRLPGFLYFDEYNVMSGRVSLPRLLSGDERTLGPSERTVLSLLRVAHVDVSEFDAGDYNSRKAALEAAANQVTEEVLRYWNQNSLLCVDLDIDFDGHGVGGAPFIDIRIRNQRHHITLNFNERSQGFAWFFSFLASLSEFRRCDRSVLLLDEPGLGLHAAAQRDLLRYIDERLAPSHQVVYSTHSPFMVAATDLDRVRTVEDRDGAGSQVSHTFFDHSDETRLPLQTSLGRELVRSLSVAPNALLVTAPSDHVFLTVVSGHLERNGRCSLDPRWTVVPVGGLSGVCAFFASLHIAPNVAIISGLHGRDGHVANSPMGREMSAREGVIRLADIAGTEQADIEDLFAASFYLELVNRSNAAAIEAFEVQGEGRIVERIESVTGTELNRYLPARFLLEHPDTLSERLDDSTLERFETLFRKVNESIGKR